MMDCIYSQAQLTIIAAAGEDPTYGLPGISSTARNPQHRLQLGDIELVQIHRSDEDVYYSKWASRGWTFQEGYLSRRRLMFTEHEVLYLCDQMCCQESVRQDLRGQLVEHSQPLSGMDFRAIFPKTSDERHGQIDLAGFLAEYDNRNLKYPTDILDACQGILKGLRIPQLWGIPVKQISWWDQTSPPHGKHTLNLYWRTEAPGRRREAFPTWSWTGWEGMKDFFNYKNEYADVCVICFMAADGNWQMIDGFSSNSMMHLDDSITQCISITGATHRLEPYLVNQAWVEQCMPGYKTRHKGPFAIFPFSATIDIFATVRLDEDSHNGDISSHAIALTINRHKKYKFRSIMLALEPCGDRYKRIGLVECLHIGVFKDKRDWTESRKFLHRQHNPLWMKNITLQTVCVE